MDSNPGWTYAAFMKIALLFGSLLLFAVHVRAAEAVALRTGILAQSDFEWTADGDHGLCPDIFKAVQKIDPGMQFTWTRPALPERRLISELGVGDIDVACGFVRTPEREQQFQIPEVVLFEKTLVAVVRDGDKLDLNNFGDLKALGGRDTVLVNAGSQVPARLRRLGVSKVDDGGASSAVNLQKLLLGRGRVFLYDDPALDWEARHTHFGVQVHAIPAALDVNRYYMLLSQRLSPALTQRLGRDLARLRDDGSLREIIERWATRVELGRAGGNITDGHS
jgi:ABC-type amino acid transport substrate-binding protein